MPRPIQELIDELQEALDAQTEVREPRFRHVAKMAKNIQHGDHVELPYFGWVQIGAWCSYGDTVHLGDGGQKNLTVPATDRLRIRREV